MFLCVVQLVESEVGSVTNTLVNSVGSDLVDGEVEDTFTLAGSATSQQVCVCMCAVCVFAVCM